MHDPVRGGAPLKSIVEDECPVEMRGHVFTSDRPVIVFHRIKDFQVVTMKLLAQEVLRECPNFKGMQTSSVDLNHSPASVQLTLPGEVARKKLSFNRPITVYVSHHNPGAALAIKALQDGFGTAASRRASLNPDGTTTSRAPIRSTGTPPGALQAGKFPAGIEERISEISTATGGRQSLRRGSSRQAVTEATHMVLYLNQATFVGEEGELFAEEVRSALASGFPMVMVHENDEAAGGCEFAHFFVTTPQDLIADGLYSALAYAWYPDPFRAVSVALVAQAFGAEEPLSTKSSVGSQIKRLGKRAAEGLGACLTTLGAAVPSKRGRAGVGGSGTRSTVVTVEAVRAIVGPPSEPPWPFRGGPESFRVRRSSTSGVALPRQALTPERASGVSPAQAQAQAARRRGPSGVSPATPHADDDLSTDAFLPGLHADAAPRAASPRRSAGEGGIFHKRASEALLRAREAKAAEEARTPTPQQRTVSLTPQQRALSWMVENEEVAMPSPSRASLNALPCASPSPVGGSLREQSSGWSCARRSLAMGAGSSWDSVRLGLPEESSYLGPEVLGLGLGLANSGQRRPPALSNPNPNPNPKPNP